MSLRRQQPKDSLDMLLDTMCNAFGGIILLAVLVALLARQSPGQDGNSSENEEMLTRRVAQAELTLAQAQASHEELAQRSANPALQRIAKLANEQAGLQRQLADIQLQSQQQKQQQTQSMSGDSAKRLQELNQQLAQAVAARITASNSMETLSKEIQRLQSRLRDIRQQTSLAQQEVTQRLRLPKERNTTKDVFNIIVQHGKVYPLRTADLERNTAMVEFTSMGDGVVTTPKPNQGFDPARETASLSQLFRRLPRGEFYLAFYVFEDSFATFNQAKQAALAAGLDYGWMPLELKEAPISFGSKGTRPKAQ